MPFARHTAKATSMILLGLLNVHIDVITTDMTGDVRVPSIYQALPSPLWPMNLFMSFPVRKIAALLQTTSPVTGNMSALVDSLLAVCPICLSSLLWGL